MQLRDGHLVLSATDITRHVACPHITTLDLAVAEGRLEAPPDGVDAQLELVFAQGRAHEAGYLRQLRESRRRVVEIPQQGRSLAEQERLTVEAMRSGADAVYQATLFDGAWVGFADFLLRNDERPSRLGPWSYDIADTKLARRLTVPALLQMASYAARLTELQGVAPERLVVVAGDRQEHAWRLVDVEAYARRVREELTDAVRHREPTRPVPVSYCGQCRWQSRCRAEWEAADDLSLVAGLRTDQRERLVEAGITTMTQLARAGDEQLAGVLSRHTRQRLRSQAELQVQERETGRPAYRLLPPEPGKGLLVLPPPDEGDVYLDFEGDPFADEGRGREYLAGVWTRDGQFHEWWAHDAQEEARLTGDLLRWLVDRWRAHPGMHIYHYANYEQAALKRLTQQHATGESELDQLLRGERFVDLYAVVRQGVQLSKPSYSIKKVEDFYWGHTRTGTAEEVTDALTSVVEYERWLAGGRTDDEILEALRRYNCEDVRSTHDLHAWLEGLRAELEQQAGGPLPRPGVVPLEETRDSERIQAEDALAERLVAAGQPLLAGCVGWHRREDKSYWWDYFRTPRMSVEELVEDRTTVGDVAEPELVGQVRRSRVWRYRFPPQEGRLKLGEYVEDAHTHERVGRVCAFDLTEGWVDVSRAAKDEPSRPVGLVMNTHVNNIVLRDSLMRLGEQVLAGERPTGLALLERRVPCDMEPRPGESPTDVVRRVGVRLHGEVLAVQGPPGSGKTYAGSHLIADLLDAGLRVGVTAQSHSVVANLMAKVGRPGLRKVGSAAEVPDEPDPADPIRLTADNAEVEEALASGEVRLVGGTAWLWARESMAGSVDVLVIDEAGQFSLANALAVSQAARSLVLLGDPQQLTQPTSATHPHGSGVSALEHLLDGQETITSDRGVFLDRTYRMHPEITRFVSEISYADRLLTAPGPERHRVGAPGELSGSGIRWVPVLHTGNVAESPQEAWRVRELVEDLLRGTWIDDEGVERPMTVEDVLVVAPYNAHVARLHQELPEGVQVGTVDRFQGRQAPVVIYSMASSSAADAPRGVSFLYDTHRLNVAVSRAKALAVIVASPELLRAPVRTPDQLRAVNALCRFVDLATGQPADGRWEQPVLSGIP